MINICYVLASEWAASPHVTSTLQPMEKCGLATNPWHRQCTLESSPFVVLLLSNVLIMHLLLQEIISV